jgi:hypothetical protein
MAFKIGTTQIYPNGVLPTPSSTDRGAPMYSNGTSMFFSYPGAVSATPGTGWRYRTIFTHGFICAGYKGFNTWRSVNKTWHATDTTYYCGEQLDRAGAYIDGVFSDYNGYVFGTTDTWQGGSTHVSSINLHNGVMRQNSAGLRSSTNSNFGYNDGQGATSDLGGWNLANSIAIGGAATNIQGQVGYRIGGGRTDVEKLHMPTEIMYGSSITLGSGGQSTAGWGGDQKAWLAMSGSVRQTITWSNDSVSTWSSGLDIASDGQNKTLGTKYGHFYAGMGGNTDSRISKISESTGTGIASLTKLRGYGEENQQMGQDWGYMLGQYDGQQNNHTVKTTYSTDVLLQLGSAAMPKGHVGQSSGACFSAAASITSAVVM